MYKVRTSIDSKEKAKEIATKLINHKVAVSVHIREVNSMYQWKGGVYDEIEWEVEALTSNPEEAGKVIDEYHSYELPELIIIKVEASEGIEKWCNDWCQNHISLQKQTEVEKIHEIEEKYCANDYTGDVKSLKNYRLKKYGTNPILISAPHSVKQKRDGKVKDHEFYTGAIAEYLGEKLNCSVITKSYLSPEKYNDDANYEEDCIYKTAISDFIRNNKVFLFIDLHGLAGGRDSIIDICINNGKNSEGSTYHLELKEKVDSFFGEGSATIDRYYSAEPDYVLSNWVNTKHHIPSLELEINGAYRWFEGDCLQQSMNLLSILEDWLSECDPLLHSSISPCDSCEYLDQCNNCDGDPECVKSYH